MESASGGSTRASSTRTPRSSGASRATSSTTKTSTGSERETSAGSVARTGEYLCSVEETTNLPYEIQASLDVISRRRSRRRDNAAVELVLREAPSGRVEPYADFTAPRRRAQARHRIHGGRRVASFLRAGDPASLRFARGFEPDFAQGVLEKERSASRFFGGEILKFRILSSNRRIQYQFVATPAYAWVNPPQTLTTEFSTYGVRTLDVLADEDLFLPAYEYHEVDEGRDRAVIHSQIPAGYAGAAHPEDPDRADASAWIEALPVIRQFRAPCCARDDPQGLMAGEARAGPSARVACLPASLRA